MEITNTNDQQYFLLIDSSASELSINFEHIEQLVYVPATKSIRLVYFTPQKSFVGVIAK